MRDFKHLHDPDKLYAWEKKPSKFRETAIDVMGGAIAGLILGIFIFCI